MKLISMTDFVLEQKRFVKPISNNRLFGCEKFFERVENYATFLKQPLKLEMFAPCDEDGNILEDFPFMKNGEEMGDSIRRIDQYNKAKEKVLFEGFEYVKFINDGELLPYHRLTKNDEYFNVRFLDRNIEDLLTEFEYGIELAQTAIKQIQP